MNGKIEIGLRRHAGGGGLLRERPTELVTSGSNLSVVGLVREQPVAVLSLAAPLKLRGIRRLVRLPQEPRTGQARLQVVRQEVGNRSGLVSKLCQLLLVDLFVLVLQVRHHEHTREIEIVEQAALSSSIGIERKEDQKYLENRMSTYSSLQSQESFQHSNKEPEIIFGKPGAHKASQSIHFGEHVGFRDLVASDFSEDYGMNQQD